MASQEQISRAIAKLKSGPDGDRVATELRLVTQSVQVLIGNVNNLQAQIDRNQKGMKDLIRLLMSNSKELSKAVGLAEQLSRIEADLKTVPRTFPKVLIPDHSKDLKAVQSELKKLPKTFPKAERVDLSPIEDMMVSLAQKIDTPMVIDEPKREWQFDFVYDGDDVDKVFAKEI